MRALAAVIAVGACVAAGVWSTRDATPPERATTVRLRARRTAVHGDAPSQAGTTADLIAHDPFAAYAMGRKLFTREFTEDEGVFGRQIARPLLDDGVTPMVPGARAASCAACHNTPFGDAGAGPTISKNGPAGRNTPHLFGAGLVEMIGEEVRVRLLALADRNGDGFIGRGEADGVAAVVANIPYGAPGERFDVDFGRFGDADGDGLPDLDSVCRVWFVDAAGRRLPGARRLTDEGVAGYDFELQVFGWGHNAASHAPLSSTLRGFAAAAFNVHSGLQAHDPTLNRDGGGRGVTGTSLLGAPQFVSARTPDLGLARDADGASLDDPDGDGVADELTEGDLDLVEFFLLNHPAPSEQARTPERERGRAAFATMGCVRCHVPDWEISAGDARGATGDRRSFEIAVDATADGLRGRLSMLTDAAGAPRRGAATMRGVYSDFRRHDLGPAFHETQFDGSVVRAFRTPPLWGVGTSAPYGHDGASLDLDAVIRRHGGEAARESGAYVAASADERTSVVAFLAGLVLWRVEDVLCDVDGDGVVSPGETFSPRVR